MDCSHQAPPSMRFSRQEYWSRVPLPFPLIILVSLLSLIVVYASPSPYLCSWHPLHGQKKVNSAGMACSNPTPSKEMTCLHLVHGRLLGDSLWAAEIFFLRSVSVCLMPSTVLCCHSVTESCLTLCDPMDCSMPGSSILHYLLEFAQIHVHWVSDAILPSLPPLAPFFCLQSFPAFESFPMSWLIASVIGASASASVLPVNIQGWFPLGSTGLISLLVQRTFKNLHHCHSLKASFLQHSAFFMVQLSLPYITAGKTIVLTIWSFVGKMMSLLLNTLSRFIIAFLPRSKHLLISWLQSLSTVILESKETESVTASTFSPSVCREVM